ncbi:glycoside hydrolase family 18 protein [Mycena leptocephala]|nr:glycoside hydrolase family 18 protein [Mycena leptocephala]
MFSTGVLSVLALSVVSAFGYDPTRSDNVRVLFFLLASQNSYGALNPGDTANWQKTISTYCQDSVINAIPIAFIDVFFSTGGLPDLNMANICNNVDDSAFAGTGLANCQFLAAGIQGCQAAGKIVTISLGGASGAATFSSDAQGKAFADTIWNLFLGGTSSTRPFGAAVLDGVDLDIEGGGPTGFAAFVTQLRTHTNGASKPYYITAAPQCPFPDAYLGSIINAVGFDALYVQFYNNFCSVASYPNTADWNFGTWDNWAKTVSPNKNIKIFIGAPAAPGAGAGYVSAAQLGAIAVATRAQYSSFGGIMLWDASQAYANGRFDAAVKNLIATSGGGTTTSKTTTTTSTSKTTSSTTTKTTTTTSTSKTTTTTSSTTIISGSCAGVAAWVSTTAYVGGSEVTFNGHLWQAKWWSEADAPGGAAGDWADLGACTSLLATAKVGALPATAATLTGAAHATPAAPAPAKIAGAATPAETGKDKLQGRENSRVFRF